MSKKYRERNNSVPHRYLAFDTCVMIPLARIMGVVEKLSNKSQVFDGQGRLTKEAKETIKEIISKDQKEHEFRKHSDTFFRLFDLIHHGYIRPVCLERVYDELVKKAPQPQRAGLNMDALKFISDYCYVDPTFKLKKKKTEDWIENRAVVYCKPYYSENKVLLNPPLLLQRYSVGSTRERFSRLKCSIFEVILKNLSLNDFAGLQPLLKDFAQVGEIINNIEGESEIQRCCEAGIAEFLKMAHESTLKKNIKVLKQIETLCENFREQIVWGQYAPSNDTFIMAECAYIGVSVVTCNGQDLVFVAGEHTNYDRRNGVQFINRELDNLDAKDFNPSAYEIKELEKDISYLYNKVFSEKSINFNATNPFSHVDDTIGKMDVSDMDKKLNKTNKAQTKEIQNDYDKLCEISGRYLHK